MRSPDVTACFTGHREIPAELLPTVRQSLRAVLEAAYARGYRLFLCGGAMGFDLLAAEAVDRMKLDHPDVRLEICIPFRKQPSAWPAVEQQRYQRMLFQADDTHVLSESYYAGCFHTRNRFMVEHASLCICYLTQPKGGTAYTAAFAAKQGLRLVNVAAAFSVRAFAEADKPLL